MRVSPSNCHIPSQHCRVLCVDDSQAIAAWLSEGLQNCGYEPHVARNGFGALVRVNNAPDRYDVVIVDLRMPGMDGVELIEKLRAIGFCGKVIVYAAAISNEARRQLQGLGIRQLIQKPVCRPEIIEAVRQARNGF